MDCKQSLGVISGRMNHDLIPAIVGRLKLEGPATVALSDHLSRFTFDLESERAVGLVC
ncbi:MAG: hypothetical protein JWR15_3896, partial [Prosthecobacter sp.]|nr:hypothetical protein [Prosthecobacter sp.]